MDLEVKEISFSQDTKERKQWFTAASFSHPAKMHLQLQMYLIEHYTKVGETILDPMAGSGTILVGCALGRNVILVELEDKFVKMQRDNWEKIKSLGPMLGCKMGEAIILQGDARQLDKLLVDKCIFSPPYAESLDRDEHKVQNGRVKAMMDYSYTDKKHGKSNGQIASLPYGVISAVISSPPYEGSLQSGRDGIDDSKWTNKSLKSREQARVIPKGYTAKADAILTSPPYEGSIKASDGASGEPHDYYKGIDHKKSLQKRRNGEYAYSNSAENIGNLKSGNYLEAMLSVYQNCHRVLKDKGLLCLVVKNFIREKKIIRLDLDTIKLCEKSGFVLKERLKRKLTQQSFWRIIYHQKFPDVEQIKYEDVLVFRKECSK